MRRAAESFLRALPAPRRPATRSCARQAGPARRRAQRVARGLAGLVGALASAGALALAPSLTPSAAPTTAPSDLLIPARDDQVVEHLPTHVGDAAQRRAAIETERAQRAQLQQHPNELGLALKAANDALARGRLRGDPRELGVAQAALEPWWNLPEPPPEVRLVRATTLQSQHFFHEALVELDALLAAPHGVPMPIRAQAELTRSGVQQVLGHFAEAEAGCRRLAGLDFEPLGAGVRLNGQACLAELSSLQGHADTAAVTLARLAGAPDTGSAATTAGDAAPGWLNLMRAELAQRRGDPAAGALFAAALKVSDDVYTECAYADWLLDQHRPADVLALLKGHEAADPVLLRIALADKALHGAKSPVTVDAVTTLGERYDAALLRGDKSHGREQSRYELDLRGDTRAALGFAKSNWVVQHEPADEVVLAHAAHAAHRDDAAAPLWQFLRDTGGRDVRLAAGGAAAEPYLPVAFSAKTPADAMPARPLNQALMAIVAANKAARAASATAPDGPPPHAADPAHPADLPAPPHRPADAGSMPPSALPAATPTATGSPS